MSNKNLNKTNVINKISLSRDDKIFNVFVLIVVSFVFIITLYPLIYIVSASFSSARAVSTGQVVLWPVDFSIEGYRAVFENRDIGRSYVNTIFYTCLGTFINVAVTMMAAYPLARRDLRGRSAFSFIFTFTMLFNGGMVPTYLVIKRLGMIDSIWSLVLPNAISVYNMIVARTFIQNNIPNEMLEASQIDGCSDAQYFFKMVLPLSKTVIAVITLFYAVSHWNSFFNAFLYINDRSKYPLQIILREILVASKIDANMVMDEETMAAKQGLAELLKFSLIIVATAPILCVYPFIQRYFVKGVMIGSVKG
ncbi:MAG: carbohydrate ABC transporter permease [Ruminococcaceae bacterium]|nr:carbohydrate ABC transporter permease [Oscillospiraceae bacterium]